MQVHYDRVAATYNRRFEPDVERQELARALAQLAQEAPAQDVLEVGCGTGHWLAQLSRQGRQPTGLDLSIGMLTQARQQGLGLPLVRGRAERLPFPSRTFDRVLCINALHHFEDGQAFVAEAVRLLRPGGSLVVIGFDPHDRRDEWYLYDYFPGTREVDLARFPCRGQILSWMLEAGLDRVTCQPVDHIHHSKMGRAVLDDPFLQKNSCSQLALLTDEAYTAGLERIHAALATAEARGKTLVFRTDNRISMLVGSVPLAEPPGG